MEDTLTIYDKIKGTTRDVKLDCRSMDNSYVAMEYAQDFLYAGYRVRFIDAGEYLADDGTYVRRHFMLVVD